MSTMIQEMKWSELATTLGALQELFRDARGPLSTYLREHPDTERLDHAYQALQVLKPRMMAAWVIVSDARARMAKLMKTLDVYPDAKDADKYPWYDPEATNLVRAVDDRLYAAHMHARIARYYLDMPAHRDPYLRAMEQDMLVAETMLRAWLCT